MPGKAEVIMHPRRLRILEALGQEQLTTQEIAARLPDEPKSSIYRHLKILLDAGIVAVVATRPVKGVEEKVYAVAGPARLGPQDVAGLPADVHLRYFTAFLMYLLQGFESYLARNQPIDYVAQRVGYTEVHFQATDEEFAAMAHVLNAALFPLLQHPPGPGRRPQKLATITFPLPPAPDPPDGP